MRRKITLIGAGSVVFAKRLIGDILQFPELSDSTICLMDIDPSRLKVAEVMTRKMIAKLGVNAQVEATLNQRDSVRGASYVICTIQVGGYKPGTVIDFEIPKKYGVRQTIADTLGVGGVFRALRTIPVINSIAQDISDVAAPGCLLLNYTNPMAMNCWAVDRAVGIPHVGLCHSVQGTSHQLANFAGLPYDDVTYLVAGINHMAFFLKFEYRGQDAYPLLFKLLEDPNFNEEKVRFEMMRRTGYFVTESSEHQSEYVPYFIHHGDEVIKKFSIPLDEYIRRCETITASWENSERNLLGDDGEIQVEPQSHEYGAFIIHSMETNTPRVVYGNVPNRNLITSLPNGCCVELPCLVDGQGVQPTHIGPLPPQLAALCQTNINVQSLTVEAAITRRREHIYHAVMLDPHTATVCTLDQIWAMCDELIEAHQAVGLLGDYKPVIRNTGRAFAGTGDRCIARVALSGAGLDEASDKAVVELVVENPTGTKLQAPLQVSTDPAGVEIKGDREFTVQVPARSSKSRKITLLRNGSNSLKCRVDVSSANADVLCLGTLLHPRALYDTGKDGAPFSITLHGFPAVEGRIYLSKEAVRITAAVEDSDISLAPETPWAGSCVELFFAASATAGIQQFFVLPAKGKPKVLDRMLKPAKGVTASCKVCPGNYTIDVTIPRSVLGIEGEMLFDIITTIHALGDAHSGGKNGLNGSLRSSDKSAHYAIAR